MAMLNHWSNFILLQPAQRLRYRRLGRKRLGNGKLQKLMIKPKKRSVPPNPLPLIGGRLMRYDNTFRTKVATKIKRPSYAKRPSIMCVAAILSNDVMDNCPFA